MRRWQECCSVWWAGAAYGGLTVIMTWPMAVQLSSAYAKIELDFGLCLWNLWWMKKALVDLGTSPYFTSYLYHPTGTSLVIHSLSPYHGVVGIPLQLLGADVLMTYNLLYLLSFVIGGVGMFLLLRELTGNLFGAFLAGVVYVFSPGHTVSYGWTNFWGTQWLPWALLFTMRLFRARRWLAGIGLAVTLVLATLTDWHQPLLLLPAIMILALSSAFGQRHAGLVQTGVFRRLLWSLLLYGLLVSPLGYVVVQELAAGDILLQSPSGYQFELLGYRPRFGDVISYGVFLGWIPLAVATYGVVRGLDVWMKRFTILLVVFFILGLGEDLRLFAEPVLPLPFRLWRKLPLLGIMRNSIYFSFMVQVCVAVLAGYGAQKLWEGLEGWQQARFPLARPSLGTGLLALILAEALRAPLTPTPWRIHPIYEAIERDDRRGAILDAPIGYGERTTRIHAGWSMYLQTLHNRPLVGGYTSFDGRTQLTFLDQNPVLALFTDHWTPRVEGIPDQVEALRSFLAEHHVRWIILRKEMREPICDQPRRPGWSLRKFINLVAPAVVNGQLQVSRDWAIYCGDWDVMKVHKINTLVRRTVGPPVWDDDDLVAYQVQ